MIHRFTANVACLAFLGLSFPQFVAAQNTGAMSSATMKKELAKEADQIKKDSAEVTKAREVLTVAEKSLTTAGNHLSEVQKSAKERLKKSLGLEKLQQTMGDSKQTYDNLARPLKEKLHESEAYKSAVLAAATAKDRVRELQANAALSDDEKTKQSKFYLDQNGRPRQMELDAIADNTSAANAKSQFETDAAAVSKLISEIDKKAIEDSEVKNAESEVTRARTEITAAKQKMNGLIAKVKAEIAQAEENDAVYQQQLQAEKMRSMMNRRRMY